MKFQVREFSKRFRPVECAVIVMHESNIGFRPIIQYDPIDGLPDIQKLKLRATGAAIILPTGAVYIGVALCSPHDQFIKKVGRAKAIGRAVREMYADSKYNITLSSILISRDDSEIMDEVHRAIKAKIELCKKAVLCQGAFA